MLHKRGYPTFMLSRWRKEYREGELVVDKRTMITNMAKNKQELDNIKRLEKENARLQQENHLLKKWQRYLAETYQNDLESFRDTDKTSE